MDSQRRTVRVGLFDMKL